MELNPLKWFGSGSKYGIREIVLKREDSPEKANMVTQIIERANARSRKDIADWRLALISAENPEYPRRYLLYNLYDDLILDAHLSGVWESGRKEKVLSESFRIVDDATGKEDSKLTKAFGQSWFYQFIGLSLDSKLQGHSLIQFNSIDSEGKCDIELVPRRHVKPEFGEVVKEQFDDRGFKYREGEIAKWVLEIGGKKDLGLLNKAAVHLLIKKNVTQAWSEYAEIFGMPMRKGKVASRNAADIDRMERALKDMGRAAYAVMQEGEEIDFVENKQSDSFKVYDMLIERCNSELSKLLLGNTMTTDVGSNGSRAQAEVHERTSNAVIESDKRFITAICREKLFPLLILHGWPLKGKSFVYDQAKDLKAMWERTKDAFSQYDVPVEFINEQFGIPVVKRENNKADIKALTKALENKENTDIIKLHLKLDELYNPKKECC